MVQMELFDLYCTLLSLWTPNSTVCMPTVHLELYRQSCADHVLCDVTSSIYYRLLALSWPLITEPCCLSLSLITFPFFALMPFGVNIYNINLNRSNNKARCYFIKRLRAPFSVRSILVYQYWICIQYWYTTFTTSAIVINHRGKEPMLLPGCSHLGLQNTFTQLHSIFLDLSIGVLLLQGYPCWSVLSVACQRKYVSLQHLLISMKSLLKKL